MWKQLWIASVLVGCGVDDTSTHATAVTGDNGIWDNGLATNGIWENGIWENGIWENGVFQNGIWDNGIWDNGIWDNGIWDNGIWDNGIWDNGIWDNGIWENGIWENGVWTGNLAARDLLRTNKYAGQLLQYMYGCAMPAGATKTLDPGGANIVLTGAIGLAPTWDSPDGKCDESCQRWVSACVLARTNAYGEHVTISMRAPDNAPDAIKAALATTVDETTQWDKREGAYYGNLFQTTPLCDGVPATGPTCAGQQVLANTPKLFACSGPASNIPAITKRFCSSQGDNGPIVPVGECLSTTNAPLACDGIGDPVSGGVNTCHDNTTARAAYNEVITVYLKVPITTCGNLVCEDGETASCPSDCHPGTWAKNFEANLGLAGVVYSTWTGTSSVSPVDDAIYYGGMEGDVDLGGGMSSNVSSTYVESVIVAKYSKDGAFQWNSRLDVGQVASAMIAATPDGGVAVAAFMSPIAFARLAKFNADGTLAWTRDIGTTGNNGRGSVTVDRNGDLVITTVGKGAQDFGAAGSFNTADEDAYVVKASHADGHVIWAKRFGAVGFDSPRAAAIDGANNILVPMDFAGSWSNQTSNLIKLDGNGNTLWSRGFPSADYGGATQWFTFSTVAGDASDAIYTSGLYRGSHDFGPGCGVKVSPAGMSNFYVAKYAPDGVTCQWVTAVSPNCSADANTCDGFYAGERITFDRDGHLVIAGMLDGTGHGSEPPLPWNVGLKGTTIDFGAGAFENYRFTDTFLASYTTDGAFRWAKQLPSALYGNLRGFDVTSENKMVMSGTYSGSMTIDSWFIVNSSPQVLSAHPNAFLATVPVPVDDGVAPVVDDKPENIVVEATGPTGAVGWYTLPTVTDAANSGASVACSPRPNATFPIGTTTVTCTGTDPFGHATNQSFTFTVRDRTPPMLFDIPAGGKSVVSLTGSEVVTYTPTALDQVDGVRPVSCLPASGSTFTMGDHTVTCTASDTRGNTATTSFVVSIKPPAFLWSGVLQPINADGSSIFKIGNTVPVKFKLVGSSAGNSTLVAHLMVARVSSGVTGTDVEAASSGQADTGNTFRYDPTADQYVFNWSTKQLAVGTYRLSIDFGDGLDRFVMVSLKK